jgi:hypothetical protein
MRHDMSKLQAEACMNIIGAAAWSSATMLRLLDTTLMSQDVSANNGSSEQQHVEFLQESEIHHKGLKRLRKALAAGQASTSTDGTNSITGAATLKRCDTRQWTTCLTTESHELLKLLQQAMSSVPSSNDAVDVTANAAANVATSSTKAPAAAVSKKGAASATAEVPVKSAAASWLYSMLSACSTTVSYLTPAHRRVIRAREEIFKVQISDLIKSLAGIAQTCDELLRDEDQSTIEWAQMMTALQAGADLY